MVVVSSHYLTEPNMSEYARFEVFMAMNTQVMVFWVVMPYIDVVGCHDYKTTT
jgi:glycogen synthase